MKLLPLMISLSVKAALWSVVRTPVFQDSDHFTLSFTWIRGENAKKNLLAFKSFLNSVFIWLIFIPLKPSSVLSHLTKNYDSKCLKKSGTV